MSRIYNSYFDKLPKIQYDINRSLVNPQHETVTNIFFRVGFIKEVLNNIGSYYTVELNDNDTPEVLADKIYGDPGADWMIILANQIIDPQWDWPLDYDQFTKYIINKYGSAEIAQTTYHHFEMVVNRTLNPDNITSERRYIINEKKLTSRVLDVPYNYYLNYYYPAIYLERILASNTNITVDSTAFTADLGFEQQDSGDYGLQPGSLAFTQYYNTYDIEGKTIVEIINGNAVTNFDYENQLNESKRNIKIIKKEYYERIRNEFNELTNFSAPFRRRIR